MAWKPGNLVMLSLGTGILLHDLAVHYLETQGQVSSEPHQIHGAHVGLALMVAGAALEAKRK